MFGNTVTIIGNLTRDPELRYTQNGTALAEVGLAWNRPNAQNDRGDDDVSFFNITCWGSLGENVANSNLQSGSRVVVVGRLDQDRYETKEGEKRSVVRIIADEVSPSLRWATAEIERNPFNDSGGSGGGAGNAGGSQVRREQTDSQARPEASRAETRGAETSGASDVSSEYSEEPF